MAKTSSLYLLVHPGYEAIKGSSPMAKLHPIQENIVRSWDGIVESLVTRPESALVYVSPLKDAQYTTDIPYPLDPVSIHVHAEHQRRERYAAMLGKRFVPFPNEHFTEGNILTAFIKANVQPDWGNLTLEFFGEYTDACVKRWGGDFGDILGIPERQRNLRADLSLAHSEAYKIGYWREINNMYGGDKEK